MLGLEFADEGHMFLLAGAVAVAVMEMDPVGGVELPRLLVLKDLDHALVVQLPAAEPLVLHTAVERVSGHGQPQVAMT